MKKETILLVDDEKEIVDLLEVYLSNDGYSVCKCYNGTDALKCIENSDIDLAILDVMLPDIDGFRLCQKIREKFFFPIIMLTAKIEDSDKIMGLTIGADDYITKPFNPLEVVARVKTQLGYVIQCAACSVLILQNSVSLYSCCNRVGRLYYIFDIPAFEKSSCLCV